VVIGNFYSQESDSDWIEIKNVGDAEVDIAGYQIGDTASKPVHEWKEKTVIPASGSCVVDAGNGRNRLNNKGDTIYLRDSLGDQIDCVLYGNGNNGVCENVREPVGPDKPDSNCFSPTPEPTPTPTPSPTPTPTKTPAPSPTPTVKAAAIASANPSPPAKTSSPKPIAIGKTNSPSPKPTNSSKPEVKALSTEQENIERESESNGAGPSFIPFVFIFLGLALMGGASYPLWKNKLAKNESSTKGGRINVHDNPE